MFFGIDLIKYERRMDTADALMRQLNRSVPELKATVTPLIMEVL